MAELKPCPGCGGPPRAYNAEDPFGDIDSTPWVRCQECHISGPAKSWNNRADSARIAEIETALAEAKELPGDAGTLSCEPRARWAMAHSRTAPIVAKHRCGRRGLRTFQDCFARSLSVVVGIRFEFFCSACRKVFTQTRSYGIREMRRG